MAKIQVFPKTKLKLLELQASGHAIETKILSANVDVTQFKKQFEHYQNALSDLDNSLVKLNKSIWTTIMKADGRKRNKIRSNIFSHIRSYQSHSDPELVDMSTSLIPLIDRYKDVYKKSFDDQTGYTSKLIEAAKSDTFKDAVAKLKLETWFDNLNTINNKCSDSSSKRKEELGLRNQPLKTPVARAAFNAAYDALVYRLNSLAEVNGDTDFITLFLWWNELIDSYRIIISLRRGKGKGGKTDNGSSSKHDPDTGGNDPEEERPGEL